MRKIEIKNKNYNLDINISEDIAIILPCFDVSSKIKILINTSNSEINVRLNFIAVNKIRSKVDILTIIPKESINNKIKIELNSLITNGLSQISLSPSFELYNNSSVVYHSTVVGSINEKWKKYLNSRGLDNKDLIGLFEESYHN